MTMHRSLGTLIVLIAISSIHCEDVSLEIPQGRLLGETRKSIGGNTYVAFEGIPYAEPPLGSKRYKEPEPLERWTGTWNAKALPNKCIQHWDLTPGEKAVIDGSEDCLYLSVYTPKISGDQKYSVVAYIHGGAFMFGSGIEYAPLSLIDRETIFVTINYRLGPIGFLSTQDDVLPGNNGMKDQVVALKWIKDNIRHFNGDPDSITIMGMSAGGASVNYHMISPQSKGLFKHAISESGTICCPWTQQTRPKEKARILADSLGCPTSPSKDLIDCLTQRPAQKIIQAANDVFMVIPHAPFSPFAPVIEPADTKNPFLSENPYKMMADGKSAEVPWLNSVTTEEGIYPVGTYAARTELLKRIFNEWDELVPYLFDFNDTLPASQHPKAAELIKTAYFTDKSFNTQSIAPLINANSDRNFVNCVEQCAKVQAAQKTSPVYFYQFGYAGKDGLGKFLSNRKDFAGVSHGDDTGYIIKTRYMDPSKDSEDVKMIDDMAAMIAGFVKTGVAKLNGINWPRMKDGIDYVKITGPGKYSVEHAQSIGNNVWNILGLSENENYNTIKRDEL